MSIKTLDVYEKHHTVSGKSLGWWLWDETRGMNLSMRAISKEEAFVEALMYYQRRLLEVENNLSVLRTLTDKFREDIEEMEES